jgi:RimJ/RimL family protein N-acetyltransferase
LPTSSVDGVRARLEPASTLHPDELNDLDWARSLHPAMAGWLVRPAGAGPGTMVVRDQRDGGVVGVIDTAQLPGYVDVASVSVYADAARRRGGTTLEAYGLCVTALFEGGARLIHHEVISANRPIQRILRAVGIRETARFRSHAYAAGRLWDVLVYSYDAAHWEHVRTTVAPRAPVVAPRMTGDRD